MKKITVSLIVLFCLASSFKKIPRAPKKQLFILYIDNSRDKTKLTEGLSDGVYAEISKRIDEILKKPDAAIAFYASNERPLTANDAVSAKKIMQNLDYTIYPNVTKDNAELTDQILNQDLTGIKNINIDFFVTEYFLSKGLMDDNGGLFVNGLPNKLQNYFMNDESDIKVNLYYPAASKSVAKESVNKYFGFQTKFNIGTKIQYSFTPL